MSTPHVSALFAYPIKSCGGVALEEAVITPVGLGVLGFEEGQECVRVLDRQWCIVEFDDDAEPGPFASEGAAKGFVQDIRVQPALAAVQVALRLNGHSNALELSSHLCPALDPLVLPLNETEYLGNDQVVVNDRMELNWFGRPILARCAGHAAKDWITRYLHATNPVSRQSNFCIARFCGASGESKRLVSESFQGKSDIAKQARSNDTAAFADCAPFHMVSEESLADLKSRLPTHEASSGAADVRRFRPNILVKGCRAPYVEDGWLRIQLGGALLRLLDRTGRCVIPTTDPNRGERSSESEPRKTLLSYRPIPHGVGPHGGPTLGVWYATDGRNRLKDSNHGVQDFHSIVRLGDTLVPIGPAAQL